MKKIIDNFSRHSASYKKFRPKYPEELYEWMWSLSDRKDCAWDVATGNGQVAAKLAGQYKEVWATDISTAQLSLAPQLSNIHYKIERAEKTSFPETMFDMITVGQAIHWFDLPFFYDEVRRVSKPGGVLVVWGYGLLKVSPKIDSIIQEFYEERLKGYWNIERNHIDQQYDTIGFPFELIPAPKLQMPKRWNLPELLGYLRTWSAVQHFLRVEGYNPVSELVPGLEKAWHGDRLGVSFPLFIKAGRV